jgi:hypothetical protein
MQDGEHRLTPGVVLRMVTRSSGHRVATPNVVLKGPTPMSEIRRRAFILEPGESLLLAQSCLEVALRYGMWQRFTQLPADVIVSNAITATPLVNYPLEGHPAQVWAQVNPASLWHPLMWLPERLAGRYDILDADGQTFAEDDDTWAVRVALELSASGMYDAETGTWVDVLALYGLDVDDPATLERLRRWQTGGTDPILDVIDLSGEIDLEDRHWGLETAMDVVGDLRPASWAVLADDLLSTINDLADPGNPDLDTNPGLIHQAAGTIISLGRSLLDDQGTGLEDGFWDAQELLLDATAPGDPDAVLDGPIAAISTALYRVRDAHWPHLDALEVAGREHQDAASA